MIAGLFQGQQNATQQQSMSNKARIMVKELAKGGMLKGEILDRVYVKSGGCESVDGSKVCNSLCKFFLHG